MKTIASILSAALLASSFAAAPALAADALGEGYVDSGACANAHILKRITSKFDYQVHHVPDLPDVAINDFVNIREVRYEPAVEDSPIARRYCAAKVLLSDGDSREVRYLIEEGMGYATALDGFGLANETRGSNVEFCVAGFDRWMVYNGACRVLR